MADDAMMVDGERWVLPSFAVQADDHVSTCRSCGARIVWCQTVALRRAPINQDGTSHFANCPQSAGWRRPR